MSYKSVEGVTYIFDRYAWLGLEPGATKKEIEKAISTKRAANHPDRLRRAGEEVKNTAEHVIRLLSDCENILLDDALRPLYDARLEEFKKDRPKLVSTSGTAIVDLGQEYLDIDSLLSDEVEDLSELEKRAAEMCGYDAARFEMIKDMFDDAPDNDKLKRAYRNELTQKLIWLSLMEGLAWQKAGVSQKQSSTSRMLTHADEYADAVEETIAETAKTQIFDALKERAAAMQIGTAPPPLLLTDGSDLDEAKKGETAESFNATARPDAPAKDASPDANEKHADKNRELTLMDEDAIAKLMNVARKNFDDRAKYIRDVAAEKQAVLETLVTLTPHEYVYDAQNDAPARCNIYLYAAGEDGDEPTMLFGVDLDEETASVSNIDMEVSGTPLSEFRARDFEQTVIVAERNNEISDFMMEVAFVAEKHCTALGERLEAKAKPAAKKQNGAPKP